MEALKVAALTIGAVLGGYALLRALDKGAPPSSVPPFVPPPPGASPGGFPIQITSGPLVALQGHTYFATLEANGTVAAAANPERIKARAEQEGFRDVVVFTSRPGNWPGTILGDYFVRATYVAPQQKEFQRTVSVFLGSLVLKDVWIST